MSQVGLPHAPKTYDAAEWDRILQRIEQLLSTAPQPATIRLTAVKSVAESQATGGGTATLGTNCPAVTPGAPFTWGKVILADGSVGYFPLFK